MSDSERTREEMNINEMQDEAKAKGSTTNRSGKSNEIRKSIKPVYDRSKAFPNYAQQEEPQVQPLLE